MKNNPFSPSGIVKKALFGGRTDYIIRVLKTLSSVKAGSPASFYLHGELGIGKTALAKLVKYFSEENDTKFYNLNFVTSYYSAQSKQSFGSILEESLNIVADQLSDSILNKLGKKLGKLFENGKFSIGAFGVKASVESKTDANKKDRNDILIKDQFLSIASNIIREIKKKDDGKAFDGVLIIIDEMDNISDIESAASIMRGITTTLDFNDLGYISFLLIGYKQGYDRFSEGDISVKRLIDPIQLLEMPDEEVVETFQKGFKEVPINFDKDALEKNVWTTGGYPLAIQVIGRNLVEEDKDGSVDAEDWNNILSVSADELIDKEYSNYYAFGVKQKKNSDKIALVFAIATRLNIEYLSIKQIKEVSGVINPSQYLTTMVKEGVVFVDHKTKCYSIRRGLFSIAVILDLYICNGKEQATNFIYEIETKLKTVTKESK